MGPSLVQLSLVVFPRSEEKEDCIGSMVMLFFVCIESEIQKTDYNKYLTKHDHLMCTSQNRASAAISVNPLRPEGLAGFMAFFTAGEMKALTLIKLSDFFWNVDNYFGSAQNFTAAVTTTGMSQVVFVSSHISRLFLDLVFGLGLDIRKAKINLCHQNKGHYLLRDWDDLSVDISGR